MHKKLKPNISLITALLLAALTIPRVPLHDLKLISFDSFLYQSLAIIPFVIWFLVAILRRSTRPFYDFIVVGLVYGLLLGITHQILWDAAWKGSPPQLGGNLSDIDPTIEGLLMRCITFCSSLLTGLMVGTVFGLVALLAHKLRPPFHKAK